MIILTSKIRVAILYEAEAKMDCGKCKYSITSYLKDQLYYQTPEVDNIYLDVSFEIQMKVGQA